MNTPSKNGIEESESRSEKEHTVLYNSFMNAPAGIAILKGDTHIFEFANTTYEKIIGRTVALGKAVREVLPEIEQQGLWHILDDAFTTGEPVIINELPIELNRGDGILNKLYFNAVVQPLKDEKGKAERLLIHVIDITEQVEARQQVEASEKRFSMLADSIPNLAWMAYADGNIFWYNKKWFEYTGTTLAEMQGWGWQSVHDPEELPKVLIKWRASIETGKPFEMVFPIKGVDGKFRQFLTRVLPVLDSENKIYRWFGTNTDIDEEKMLTEEKFLLEFAENFSHYTTGVEFFSSLVTFIAKKTEIDYVFIGELTEKEKDIFTIKTISLANRGTLVPNIEYPLPDGPCEQIVRGTLYNYPSQCRITFPKNQTIVQFNVEGYIGYPLFDSDGNAIGLVAVMHEKEISNPEYVSALLKIVARRAEFEMERNIITRKLEAKNIELENTNAELASFSYVASHDLKEPLRKIQAFSRRILETETFSEKTQDYFNRIITSGERMQNLIDSLLNFSQINITELILELCDLNTIVEESKNDLHERILEKQAIIEYENLPTIRGVYIQIYQLITNLLDNSIKYGRPEIKPHIKITSLLIDGKEIKHPLANKQKEYQAIKITDNGIGFEQQYTTKIFELFQRLHGKNDYSGTGIGLTICKKIADNHDGFIVAEGKPDIGSIFTIYIPN